jgi:hypothetical protein
MKMRLFRSCCLLGAACSLLATGCHWNAPSCEAKRGPAYDRPFPLGQVSGAHWEAQQTNAEAADFVFYDHEFVGETTELNPAGQKHLMSVAVRMEHVPFPVVVEQSVDNRNPPLDAARRQAIIDGLTKMGLCAVEPRVVVAPAFATGLSAIEGEAAYYQALRGGGISGGGGYNWSNRRVTWW